MSKPKKSLANWRGSQWQSPAKRSSGKAEPCIAGAKQGHVARWHCRDLSRNGRARPSFAQAEQSPVWFGSGKARLSPVPQWRCKVMQGQRVASLGTAPAKYSPVPQWRSYARSSSGTVMHRPARARFGHPSARWGKVVRWHSPPLHCQSEHRHRFAMSPTAKHRRGEATPSRARLRLSYAEQRSAELGHRKASRWQGQGHAQLGQGESVLSAGKATHRLASAKPGPAVRRLGAVMPRQKSFRISKTGPICQQSNSILPKK